MMYCLGTQWCLIHGGQLMSCQLQMYFHILLILQLLGTALQVHICSYTFLCTRLYQDCLGLCRALYKKPTQHHPLDTQVCICQGCCFFGAACGAKNIQAHPFPSHGVASLTGALLPTGLLLQDLVAALQGICVWARLVEGFADLQSSLPRCSQRF